MTLALSVTNLNAGETEDTGKNLILTKNLLLTFLDLLTLQMLCNVVTLVVKVLTTSNNSFLIITDSNHKNTV